MLGEAMKRPGDLCKVSHETPVVSCESQELLDLLGCRRRRPSCYFLHFRRVRSHDVTCYDMSQVIDLALEKCTLLWLKLQTSLGQPLEDGLQIVEVIFEASPGDDNIVNVH